MADFNFTVTTDPLAREIDGVKDNVKLVGGAVTAMEAAVIASERKAANDICTSIDTGFYLLMRSRLSQRISQFASIMNSRVGSMMETASAIDRTHRQMEEDFNRIKSRYAKLFASLNNSLEHRVRQLDRNAMDIAAMRTSLIVDCHTNVDPSAFYYASDTSRVALKSQNARVKARVSQSIEQLGNGAQSIMTCARTTRSIMESDHQGDSSYVYMPVIYALEESPLMAGSFSMDVYTPRELDSRAGSSVAEGIRRNGNALRGSDERELVGIRTAFIQKLNKNEVQKRVGSTMMELFNASFFPQSNQPSHPDTAGAANVAGGMA